MLNRICLVGRLTADPELKTTQTGKPIASFRLAVNRDFKTQDQDADFIQCIAFGQPADFIRDYASKGRLAAIDGRLQVRNWTTQDGQKRTVSEVVAERVNLLDKRESANRTTTSGQASGSFDYSKPVEDYDDAFADN